MSLNATAVAQLARLARQLRESPEIAKQVAPKVAERLREKLVEDYSAQRSPDGTPWTPANDGRTMLQSAPGALQVNVNGATVEAKIKSRNLYRHHAGIARGRKQRPLMPTKQDPTGLVEIVQDEVSKAFKDHFSG